ncbi:MAG: DUF4350 domain-containing protein, partial [Candidatus Thorarchaeota archaeon]
MKRVLPYLVITIFLFSMLATPAMVVRTNTSVSSLSSVQSAKLIDARAIEAQFIERTIRVAVYNEPNTTLPDYATGGVYSNNYANVEALLDGAGYDVTVLTVGDILNHDLNTASFDVLVLVDSLPRENITNLVKEFWLGGGGILSFNSAMGYLFNYGMIYHDTEGDFGLSGYQALQDWDYLSVGNLTVSERHPIAKAFHPGDTIIQDTQILAVWNNLDMPSAIGDHYVTVAYDESGPTIGAIAAIDNPDLGGKIVQLPGNCSAIPAWQNDIIIDSVDWLTPRPKARIVFDLSHRPHYRVDPWDQAVYAELYSDMRNLLVNHSFTFDKLYASTEGNLTLGNLEPYDILFIMECDYNFTAAEITAVSDWVNQGGSVFALSDAAFQPAAQENFNHLTTEFGMTINETWFGPETEEPFNDYHPLREFVVTVNMYTVGAINYTGTATPLMTNGTEVIMASNEVGDGRVLLCADRRFLTNGYIEDADNNQFAINAANWLSSKGADILV